MIRKFNAGRVASTHLFAGFLLIFSIFAVSSPAQAQDRDCTRAEAQEGDRWASLNARDTTASIRRHLPWGEPTETSRTTNERTIVLTDYVNRYDDDLRVPVWSAERIDSSRLGKTVRINCFRPHPRFVAVSDNENDYDEALHDQGHLTPAADQDSSITAMVNTFFYTNMAPQLGQFNRGIWARLESVVRTWVQRNRTVYVISGSIFDRNNDNRRDADTAAVRMVPRHNRPARVAIPTAFFKIISYRRADGRLATLSLILPHQVVRHSGRRQGQYFQENVRTVADIERLTGLNFFPNESNIGEETNFCSFAGGAPTSLCGS